jgi:hypothetical protein
MRVRSEEVTEAIRRELQAIVKRGSKITERDLLRLSAQTGIDYSTVVRIQQELAYGGVLPGAEPSPAGRRGVVPRGGGGGWESPTIGRVRSGWAPSRTGSSR